MFTLRGTELALSSVSKAKKKGNESHENQFIIVGNPASSNPDNSLDSHFSSSGGVSTRRAIYCFCPLRNIDETSPKPNRRDLGRHGRAHVYSTSDGEVLLSPFVNDHDLSRFASSIAKKVCLTNLLKKMCCINGDKPKCSGLSLWPPIHSVEPSGFC